MRTHTSEIGSGASGRQGATSKLAPVRPNKTHPLSHASHLRAKLTVSQADDPYELEADRVAEQVLRAPGPAMGVTAVSGAPAQRMCSECEDELEVHRSETRTGGPELDAA